MNPTPNDRKRNCHLCTSVCNTRIATENNNRYWDSDMFRDFPVKIACSEHFEPGPIFESHWHEQFQILYFKQGAALIHCNSHSLQVKPGNFVIINSNEIHYGESLCLHLLYYVVKVDLNFLLSSQMDLCQMKYMSPLMQNQIRFQNYILQNEQLSVLIQQIINEYSHQETGCELAIKASIYHILVILLRHYTQEIMPKTGQERNQNNLKHLRKVLEYVDRHYSENISLQQLASLSNMSSQHFCRLFKNLTGKRPMDYINYLRISKAVTLLTESELNISEIAMAVGFNDSNYFSRLFKKYQKISPSAMRK